MSKGQVLRADDARCRPHSPERRAAMKFGMRRTEWSQRQSMLARGGNPHTLVPLAQRAADILHKTWPDRLAPDVGSCHWCFFWDRTAEHTDDDPMPVKEST